MAVPWYDDEKSYLAVVAMLPASEAQDAISHDAFISKIKGLEQKAQSQGFVTHRIPIDAATLKGWCDANNLLVCRKSIAEYITICLGLILRGSGRN